ncbi:kelch domain-containing protein 7A [Erinaceus europaeus]|uniref:Kelch domain-containing protein 7A n=1 Tax=Erinaceus europaeus TaxID=9365 RepID=A0ABM3Y711_ERIEU|nr:kelch domain-containing protein 7A [Erinaceus europaeus]
MLPGGGEGGGGEGGGAEFQDWHLNMQLTGKVVLAAAALLLVTAAYRLYKSRSAWASQEGRHTKAQAQEEAEAEPEAEGSGQSAFQRTAPRIPHAKPRRRRRESQRAGGMPGCSWEEQGASQVLAQGVSCSEAERQETGEEQGQRCPGCDLVPPGCESQEAGTAVGAEPKQPLRPRAGSEPESCPASLSAAASSGAGGELTPQQDDGPSERSGAPEQGSLQQPWQAHVEGASDVDNSWAFTGVARVRREEGGALQAASDLALHQQEGATNSSYTFSSVARVRMENFIQQRVQGTGPRLRGKVYDYYVESTSLATSGDRLGGSTAALGWDGSPPALPPGPLETDTAREGPTEDVEGGAQAAPSSRTAPAAHARGLSRRESLLQIVENPELQLQLDGFGGPSDSCPGSEESSGAGSARSGRESHVQLVARTNFFHLPLAPGSAAGVHLDLGNCSEVLSLAKRQKLETLKEAAYQVMSDNYLQVLRSPDVYGSLNGAERELILLRRLRGRKRLVVADVCPQEDSGRLCCYDDERDAWHPLARLPPEAVSRGCAVCSLFNYLFLVSGCQGPERRPSRRVFCFNPLTGIWSEVCPLNQARPSCRLVALDGHLYAIGGECLNTVERYDPRLDRWTFAPPLPDNTFVLAHTATASAREIFITGGTLRYLLLRFSAAEGRWWPGLTTGSKERTAEMVAVDGFLYRFDLNRVLGIGVYRCSASARLWYECANHREPYPEAFRCAVLGSLVYCVGHRRTLCFHADARSPRFVPKKLQSFPSPRGTLLPTTLTLPSPDVPQTRV